MGAPDYLNKMRWKPPSLCLVNAPAEILPTLTVGFEASTNIVEAPFTLLFVRDSKEVEKFSGDIASLPFDENILWVGYPKKTSSQAVDLSRDILWNMMRGLGLTGVAQISIDKDWSAIRFKPEGRVVHSSKGSLNVPEDLIALLQDNAQARRFFYGLSATNRKEYIAWITSAKKSETRERRMSQIIERLLTGLKNPTEKYS